MTQCNIFLIFVQMIDCGYTLEPPRYPQSIFWSKIRKNVYPCKPHFYFIKVGCKGVFVTRTCFRDDNLQTQTAPTRLCFWNIPTSSIYTMLTHPCNLHTYAFHLYFIMVCQGCFSSSSNNSMAVAILVPFYMRTYDS